MPRAPAAIVASVCLAPLGSAVVPDEKNNQRTAFSSAGGGGRSSGIAVGQLAVAHQHVGYADLPHHRLVVEPPPRRRDDHQLARWSGAGRSPLPWPGRSAGSGSAPLRAGKARRPGRTTRSTSAAATRHSRPDRHRAAAVRQRPARTRRGSRRRSSIRSSSSSSIRSSGWLCARASISSHKVMGSILLSRVRRT